MPLGLRHRSGRGVLTAAEHEHVFDRHPREHFHDSGE
jgi:hypothetical protein